MPAQDELPNFLEADIADIWKYRQQHKEQEDWAQERRRHADREILRRGVERDAQIFPVPGLDPIVITYSSTYKYTSAKVDADFFSLIQRDGLTAEWNRWVQHNYKIDRRWINQLMKHGQEYRDAIEDMTEGGTGSPSIKGPDLSELGDYAPRGEEA